MNGHSYRDVVIVYHMTPPDSSFVGLVASEVSYQEVRKRVLGLTETLDRGKPWDKARGNPTDI